MQESDHRSPLLEKVLRPGDTNVRNQLEINRLCDTIRQTSFEIHKYFRSGHLEKIYANALTHRLTKLGIDLINFGGLKLQIKKYILSRDAQP